MNEIQRFFKIIQQINGGNVPSKEDLKFFYEYAPQVDNEAIAKIQESKDFRDLTPEEINNGLYQAMVKMQSDPEFKQASLDMAEKTEKAKFTENLSKGLDLILKGTDIATSIQQIAASKAAAGKSKKPSRPTVPLRDSALQQALRQAQDVTQGVQTALAPVQAQIQDQYQSDLANARTASTGQAGVYGSYAQLAANRRNRAAMELAPIADQVRARNQGRLDNLIGARIDETQQRFQNEASLYPYDLHQYGAEQQAIADLGSTGRQNLRNSLYNFAGQVAPTVADYYTQRKYNDLRNKATSVMGEDLATKYALPAQQQLDEMYGVNYHQRLTPYQLYRQSLNS